MPGQHVDHLVEVEPGLSRQRQRRPRSPPCTTRATPGCRACWPSRPAQELMLLAKVFSTGRRTLASTSVAPIMSVSVPVLRPLLPASGQSTACLFTTSAASCSSRARGRGRARGEVDHPGALGRGVQDAALAQVDVLHVVGIAHHGKDHVRVLGGSGGVSANGPASTRGSAFSFVLLWTGQVKAGVQNAVTGRIGARLMPVPTNATLRTRTNAM